MPKLDGETIVTGNAVPYVTDLIKFGASESLTILPGASLTIHYDESLRKLKRFNGVIVASWREL
jgi:hypothetical protein